MHSYPNQFHRLPFSEQFLIWAIRKWVQNGGDGFQFHGILRDACRLARVPKASVLIDGFLTVLSVSAERAIIVHAPDGRMLSSDENRMLAIIGFLQSDGGRREVELLLSSWMPSSGVRIALQQCTDLAKELGDAGHFIRPRHWPKALAVPEKAEYPASFGGEAAGRNHT